MLGERSISSNMTIYYPQSTVPQKCVTIGGDSGFSLSRLPTAQAPSASQTLNLAHWFTTPAGESLRAAEARALSAHLPRLTGEILVCASIFANAEDWQRLSPARLKVWQVHEDAVATGPESGPATPAGAARVHGRLASLPYADGSVDALVVQHGFEEVPDLARSVRETLRVLREDGRMLVITIWPLSGVGVRSALGKLPKTRLLDAIAIRTSRLLPIYAVKHAFARHGIDCEQEETIEGGGAKARLLVFRKRRMAADTPEMQPHQGAPDEMGLLPASRTSGVVTCDRYS